MKKIIVILILMLLSGCKLESNDNMIEPTSKKPIEEKVEESQNNQQEPEYTDTNPLKVAFYQESGNVYKKVSEFKSPLNEYKDIGVFSVILDGQDEMNGKIKELYNNVKNNYEDFSKYKIGYNINFKLNDGTIYNETILKPLDLFSYTFSNYLYIWLYDDVNSNGWHSHLEEKDYNENTVMSSIKLMSTSLSKEVDGGFNITVFTYDTQDDFDNDGNYRGNSKFTLVIEYKED